ncbi:MAG TPA: hypothetical protein VHO06_17370 [Polyangia bacterium]|nr:hypothetical protein [Polyangia bacterium]
MNARPKHLTVRNVPPAVMQALERERRKAHASLNQTVIDSLSRGLGVSIADDFDNGLGALAGTWSAAELRAFEAATKLLDEVDEELWK